MKFYFPVIFVFMSLFFLLIGLRVVVQKRPLVLSARYFFGFMVLAFSPQIVNVIAIAGRDGLDSIFTILWINPIIFTCLLVFMWIQMKGFMLIGIHDDSFRDARHSSTCFRVYSLPFICVPEPATHEAETWRLFLIRPRPNS